MKVTPLNIPDVLMIQPEVFSDERGFFFESFNQLQFEKKIGKRINFVQDSHSKSSKGVLRGLHYQFSPKAQAKLVRVIQGEVFDVVVDLRHSSSTFGQWAGETLSAENKKQLWIPEGFAHGFITLSITAELVYKATNFYFPESEHCIIWNDKTLNIQWPQNLKIQLSSRDQAGQSFKLSQFFS